MFSRVKIYLKEYREALFVIDQHRLSKGSKSLLFIFLVTIFTIIGWGLSWQKAQTKSPSELYGYECNNLVNIVEPLDYNYFRARYLDKYNRDGHFGESIECKTLGDKYLSFIKSKRYGESLVELKRLESQRGEIEDRDEISSKIKEIKNLNNYPEYIDFNIYYNAHRDSIKDKYLSQKRLYHFRQTLQAFGFLVPIWLLFYLIYRAMVKRRYFILAHLTIHVANVSAIYGLFYLINFIYEIMPKIFLERIIDIFMQYNLTIFLNILVILFFIIIFGILIYRVQKNSTTGVKKRKEEIDNISNGRCSECSSIITGDYCSLCGFKHYIKCSSCGKDRLSRGNFCQECGE